MSGDAVWTAVVDHRHQSRGRGLRRHAPGGGRGPPRRGNPPSRPWSRPVTAPKRCSFGLYPDSIGASSTLLCLIGAVVLAIIGVASYRILIGDILGVLAMGYALNWLAGPDAMPYLKINPFYHLLMGGTAFGIAFMTTDPVSAPHTHGARWIYGFPHRGPDRAHSGSSTRRFPRASCWRSYL